MGVSPNSASLCMSDTIQGTVQYLGKGTGQVEYECTKYLRMGNVIYMGLTNISKPLFQFRLRFICKELLFVISRVRQG